MVSGITLHPWVDGDLHEQKSEAQVVENQNQPLKHWPLSRINASYPPQTENHKKIGLSHKYTESNNEI
jgi:hypothetical protein